MNTLKRNPVQLVLAVLAVLAVTAGAWGTLLAAGPGDKAPQVSSPTPTAHPDDAPVGDDWPRGPLPRVSPTPIPLHPKLVISHTATALDRAKPRFLGELGDFIVVPDQARNLESCPSGRGTFATTGDPELERSELFFTLPGYKLSSAGMCDGRVVWVLTEDQRGGTALRGYFTAPKAKVELNAPRDRIQLVTVAGRPGIVRLPVPGRVTQASALLVLQRPPDAPVRSGIFVHVTTVDQGPEYVQRIAEQIMAQGGAR